MGLFSKTGLALRRAAARFAVRGTGVEVAVRGKATGSEDLTPVGSWQALFGTVAVKDANEIWKTYTDSEKESAYKTASLIHACVNKIAHSAKEATLRIGRRTRSGEIKEIGSHYIHELLTTNPNPSMGPSQFREHCISHLLLTGEDYVWEFRDPNKYIEAVWPIPTSWVDPQRGDYYNITSYKVAQGRRQVSVLPSDMTFTYLPDPGNPLRGSGPLDAAMRDYQTESERANYLIEMLTNLKVAGMVLKQEEGWTDPQKAEARAILEDKIGQGHRGSPLFISGEHSAVEMLAPLKDLDWPGVSGLTESRICSAFGVPPILIGSRIGMEHATYSNYEQADRSFYNETMIPLWTSLGDAWTRGFLVNEPGETRDDLILWFDYSQVKQLQEDQSAITERAGKALQDSIITRNEAREEMGKDLLPADKGDVFLVPINVLEVPVEDLSPIDRNLQEEDESEDHETINWDEEQIEEEEDTEDTEDQEREEA